MKKLSKFELNKIYETIRLWLPEQRNTLRPLVGHIQWLEQKVKDLEFVNDKFRQKSVFENIDKENRIQAVQERQKEYLSEPSESFDKKKMLYELKKNGKTLSIEWQRICKWLGLSDVEAHKIADSYKEDQP